MALTSYVVLLFSLSFHESAHGWMAYKMGDDTAMSQGRVTLNPLVHIDPVGTVLMPLLMTMSVGVPFLAWAKPTPVGAHNFKNLSRGHILVAGAGPISNLVLVLVFTGVLFVAVRLGLQVNRTSPSTYILLNGVVLNISLAIFNMVPLPPLDGSWVASWALPRNLAHHYDRVVEPYGTWILLLLVVSGGLQRVLGPLTEAVSALLMAIVL